MNNFSTYRFLNHWAVTAKSAFVGVLLVAVAQIALGQQSKTCHTCNPNHVPGSIVESNMTLGQLSEKSLALLSDADGTFMGNLYGYCMAFPGDVRGAKTLRKRLISKMEGTAPNGKVDSYFLEAGCNPDNLGSSRVPLAQIAAELPSVRIDHLEVVRKYFIEKNKDGLFTKMLNAKNTRGHTTLDYLAYLVENRKFTQFQVDASPAFKKYLCANGAVYSVYRNQSCAP